MCGAVLREEYALDALVDYGVVADNPTREVPNPAWNALDARIRDAREDLARIQAQYGREAFVNPERRRRTMRGFKIAQGKRGRSLRAAMKLVATLQAKRAALPKRVPVQEGVADKVVKLAPERKHLTSLIKMVAYQAESDLVFRWGYVRSSGIAEPLRIRPPAYPRPSASSCSSSSPK